MTERTAYVVLYDDWEEARRLATSYEILDVLADDLTYADIELEWYDDHAWPIKVREAADRLRARFQPAGQADREELYLSADLGPGMKEDCLLVAPFAHDARFRNPSAPRGQQDVASLHDENLSTVFWLSDNQYEEVCRLIGPQNLRTLAEHHRVHRQRSAVGRLSNRIRHLFAP